MMPGSRPERPCDSRNVKGQFPRVTWSGACSLLDCEVGLAYKKRPPRRPTGSFTPVSVLTRSRQELVSFEELQEFFSRCHSRERRFFRASSRRGTAVRKRDVELFLAIVVAWQIHQR